MAAIIFDGRSLSREAMRIRQQVDDDRESAFVLACVYGVLRNFYSLRAQLTRLMPKKLRNKDADIECLLLSSLYQIQQMQVADHAVVSASVEAARVMQKSWACGLVNAVLRRTIRETELVYAQDETTEFEHASWLVDLVRRAWPQDWREILEANNRQPPLCLRVNRNATSVSEYLTQLTGAGHPAQITCHSTAGIVLDNAVAIERIPGFEIGLCSVQDEAAQLAASLLDLGSATRVLDACAAPGGKTMHILEQLAGRAAVIALDRDAGRLADLEKSLARLHLQCQTIVADAAAAPSWWDGQLFDRILLDAPCSATGVIRRHPDIRFHRSAADIQALIAEQSRLLGGLWPLLANGGTLLYATCSIVPAENDDVVERMRAQTPDMEVMTIPATWGRQTHCGRQILPGEDNMDGFYYALLRKRQA